MDSWRAMAVAAGGPEDGRQGDCGQDDGGEGGDADDDQEGDDDGGVEDLHDGSFPGSVGFLRM